MTECSKPQSECPWAHDPDESTCEEAAAFAADKFGVIGVAEPVEPDDLTGAQP